MRWTQVGRIGFSAAIALMLSAAVQAAAPYSNSLTGFTGDSTQAGTQADLAAAGLSVFSTTGEIINDNGTPGDPGDDIVESNHTVVYDGSGAHFGSLITGDAGRNYMRTVESDYATTSFRVEITFTANDAQNVFIGIGAGDTALFGTPDWSTQFSSASFWPETGTDKFVRFRTQNDMNTFGDTNVPGFDPGTHRFRMSFDSDTNRLTGEIDLNYAGGPFVADPVLLNFPIVVTSLFAPDGWPSEPSRIFFGGDDGVVFRDLNIRVIPEPSAAVLALLGFVAIGGARRLHGRR